MTSRFSSIGPPPDGGSLQVFISIAFTDIALNADAIIKSVNNILIAVFLFIIYLSPKPYFIHLFGKSHIYTMDSI